MNKKKTKVYQYDAAGNYIKEWDSLSSVKKSGICLYSSVIKNKRMAGGYMWFYKYQGNKINPYKKKIQIKTISVFDKFGKRIAVYDSVSQCAKALQLRHDSVCHAAKYETFRTKNYLFRYGDVSQIEFPKRRTFKRRDFKELVETSEGNHILSEGIHYLYRHIRLDTNEVFYVGIGTKLSNKTFKSSYNRAFSKSGRSKHWNNITNKVDYKIEILLESDNYSFILRKEIEFIALYGRRDLGKGTLINLTDGGEGTPGVVINKQITKHNGTRASNYF